MSAEGAKHLPNLPVDAWHAIARAALHVAGYDVRAWVRFSLVNSVWRAALQGALVNPWRLLVCGCV